jgi:hypothetical protein
MNFRFHRSSATQASRPWRLVVVRTAEVAFLLIVSACVSQPNPHDLFDCLGLGDNEVSVKDQWTAVPRNSPEIARLRSTVKGNATLKPYMSRNHYVSWFQSKDRSEMFACLVPSYPDFCSLSVSYFSKDADGEWRHTKIWPGMGCTS